MQINENPASYAANLSVMTDDEIFSEMQALEQQSEVSAKDRGPELEAILGQIALVEQEIEQRFPGQALAPYKLWKREKPA